MLLRLSLLSALVIIGSCQLRVEVSSEDVIVPDTTTSPDTESTSTEFESSKLDFLRRRRRKMMTSTVSPALKILPKEPRITMKPSTVILKQDFEKKSARPTSSHFKDFKNKRRRFKPKLSKLNKSHSIEKNQDDILLKTNHSNQGHPQIKTQKMLQGTYSDTNINKTSVLTQLQSPISDSFETTNMERNRVVLLHSKEEEARFLSSEAEVEPKYAHSTTSRTLSGPEDNFILKQVASLTESGLLNISEENEMENHGYADDLEKNKSEEESEHKKLNGSDNIVEVVKDIADNDTLGQSLYRFEYKILSDNSSNENTIDDKDNDSSPILNTYSPDGLYHPENAPTYEQVLNFNSVKLDSLEILNNIGLDNSIELSFKQKDVPEEKALHLPPPRPNHPPPKFFQKIEDFPVPVPQDYPIDVTIDKNIPVSGRSETLKKESKTSEVNLDFELEPTPTSISESNTNFDGTILQRQEVPRTPKIEISPGKLGLEDSADGQVTKSVYTVTTPASYVFFEQTVAPSKDDSVQPQNKRVTNLAKKLETWKTKQRNKTLKSKHHGEKLSQNNNEVERTSISFSDENLVGPIPNLRIAEIASQDHYYPNQDSYFPSNSFNSGSRPSYIPPIINPPPVTGVINYSPPPSDSYSPPTLPQSPSILYQPGQFTPPQTPVYHPPTTFNNIPTYQPFKPAPVNYIPGNFVQSDIFFKPVKKRPPHKRHQKKYPSHHQPNFYRPSHNVSPGTKFHFVEEIYDLPPKTTVKRFPSESTSSLDVNRSGSGIVSLLKSEDLTVMAALLEETELDKSIDKQGQFTLFVPTDLAFNQFLQKLGGIKEGVNKLKQNPKELERIVKNHLVKGQVRSEDLADDLVGPSVALTKLRSNVYESEDRDWKDVKIITINGGLVLKTDIVTENKQGLIHIVDRVLFPPTVGDVVETLQADPEQRFTTFIKALQATRLDKEITDYNTGPWTVFAPTNSAFMNLPMKELEELITNPKKLSKLVLNHLINRTVYSAGMRSHQRMTMANGNRVNLFARDDRLKIEGSSVINMDIPATNGVIQVVENIVEM